MVLDKPGTSAAPQQQISTAVAARIGLISLFIESVRFVSEAEWFSANALILLEKPFGTLFL